MKPGQKDTDHFRNGRFFNPGAAPHGFGAFLKWITHRKLGYWPPFIHAVPGPKPAERVLGSELTVTFVNHCTFLLQTAGLNLLTDPIWSERASPLRFAGPRRHRKPGIHFDDLPAIDAILLSHNHYDHCDLLTLRRLARRDNPAIFCPLGLSPLLRKTGLREMYEMDWWNRQSWKGIEIECAPAQHFSARGLFDRDRTLWCGWMLNAPGGSVYYAGDTGFGGLFEQIAARHPAIRLALLPIGAYEPEWFMGPVHMTPAQAVEAACILRARTAIATHFGTFPLADDSMAAPVERLRQALPGANLPGQFLVLAESESASLPEAPHAAASSPIKP